MKANEAPKKIYLYPSDRAGEEYEGEWGAIPWGEDCVEYTRTDAFIENAWDWIENNILSPNQQDESFLYYEQFKNYMKGE